MTGKRFKCTNISSNGMTGLFWLGKDQISVYDVLRVLNELYEENEQLKQKNIMLNKDLKYITDRKNHLESEWDKFYELIDKKIKELEDKYEFGRTEYGACPMHNIMFGINVLKELKKELEE